MITTNALQQRSGIMKVFLLLRWPLLGFLKVNICEGCVALVGIVEASEQSGCALCDGVDKGFVRVFSLQNCQLCPTNEVADQQTFKLFRLTNHASCAIVNSTLCSKMK